MTMRRLLPAVGVFGGAALLMLAIAVPHVWFLSMPAVVMLVPGLVFGLR